MNNLTKIIVLIVITGAVTTVFAKPVDRMLNALDSDGDGMISAEEFQPPRERGMMEHMDENQDGEVTLEEINQQIAERHAEMTARVQAFFADADADGNGAVTQAEAQAAAFRRIDVDGDGHLTAEELQNAKPPHGGRHGPRRPGMKDSPAGES